MCIIGWQANTQLVIVSVEFQILTKFCKYFKIVNYFVVKDLYEIVYIPVFNLNSVFHPPVTAHLF